MNTSTGFNLNLDQRKEELIKAIDTKQNRLQISSLTAANDIQQMSEQFEQSVQIIIDLSNIIAAFNDFIFEIEEKIKGMQEIPLPDLEKLRDRMSMVSKDLQDKIANFKDTLVTQRKKLGQGITPPPASFTR